MKQICSRVHDKRSYTARKRPWRLQSFEEPTVFLRTAPVCKVEPARKEVERNAHRGKCHLGFLQISQGYSQVLCPENLLCTRIACIYPNPIRLIGSNSASES